jgi:hypothetical protein
MFLTPTVLTQSFARTPIAEKNIEGYQVFTSLKEHVLSAVRNVLSTVKNRLLTIVNV